MNGFTRIVLVAAMILGAARSAVAAPAPPAAWIVDPAASHLNFSATVNGQAFTGGFRRWTAHILFDPANLAASRVGVAIDTGSASTGDQTRDEALPTADWFSAKAYPLAIFTGASFKAQDATHFVAAGTLRIRNVTRPMVIPFTLHIAGGVAHMTGAVTLDRTAFGVGQGQFAGAQVVAAPVRVLLDITATRTKR